MKVEDVKVVGVLGAGTMGSGIAQVCAMAGFEVILRDLEERFLERGMENIKKSLSKFVEKGKISEDEMKATLERIKTTTKLEDFENVDVVIEAIIEDMEAKKAVFRELSNIVKREDAIFASNTSTLSITEMASVTRKPENFVGIHFMNPVPLMKGVEIVRGLLTSEETVQFAFDFVRKLGKEPVVCKDSPGFISNRILMPWINEGIWVLYEGIATKEEIDRGMRLFTNVPMGPLELADLIGLDIVLAAIETLHRELGDKYKPCPLLKQMVRAGLLGRKTGRGFYDYTKK
ncbi:3-hydroxybutyryl-CoA dehydrogenase [Ferroglobus placidus DSM 10642]|uniref:3-hydroxybutyryl-CoA dehydrogenase n=1 Tax=Ferroglobus placidus (strain DSM 10642 / AEDII12DO) TaxID=589924 RepID=D3RXF1_FERPA|nr:3-hydroxybutyryl-CoA dehydrogenase [Ferroglobus placidus]ADC65164.1 3-hydroxybutyryl-CoA dehydrogenase [Ferroglobus placidus DSM 10642]